MKLAIVTDSTAFIPTAISNHPDIYILPIPVILDDKIYNEGIDIHADEYPNGFTSLISVDADAYRSQKSVKKTLTIPAWMDKEATQRHINFSSVLQDALKELLQ